MNLLDWDETASLVLSSVFCGWEHAGPESTGCRPSLVRVMRTLPTPEYIVGTLAVADGGNSEKICGRHGPDLGLTLFQIPHLHQSLCPSCYR